MDEKQQTFMGPKTRVGNLALAIYIGIFAVVFSSQWTESETRFDRILNGICAPISALCACYFGVRAAILKQRDER